MPFPNHARSRIPRWLLTRKCLNNIAMKIRITLGLTLTALMLGLLRLDHWVGRVTAGELGEVQFIEGLGKSSLACLAGKLHRFQHGHDVVGDGELLENGRLLRQVAHSPPRALVHGKSGDVLPSENDASLRRWYHPDGHAEGGGLAGPVLSQQTHNLTGIDHVADVVDDGPLGIHRGQVFDLEERLFSLPT